MKRLVNIFNRPKCAIKGCDNIVRKRSKKRKDGSKHYWLEKYCAKHRSDGTIRPSHTKEAKAASNLKHAFGMTLSQYQEMLESQRGCCKICGRHQKEFKKRLCVDHCHDTGKIRGLLCNHCNYLVGSVETESELLDKCRKYLRKY